MVRYLSWFLSIWFLSWLTQSSQATIISAAFLTIQGVRLENNVIKESESSSAIECAHLCLSDYPTCKSINFEIKGETSRRKCELNNATKSLHPENLQKNEAFNYFEMIQEHENIVDDNAANVKSSQDIDECVSNPCHKDAKCKDGIASYTCECNKGFSENGTSCTLAKSCKKLNEMGITEDGVYAIDPDGLGRFNVSCDMTTHGGGWTVFQRRIDGSVDFYLGWNDYKNGFGNMSGEFWLGLDKIHRLTKKKKKLIVDLEDFDGGKAFSQYKKFKVHDEGKKYKLHVDVDDVEGNASDSLKIHNKINFSTKDEDNDSNGTISCAEVYKGAWWYKACHMQSNLNGKYYLHGAHINKTNGVIWSTWKGFNYSLKKIEMKIRP